MVKMLTIKDPVSDESYALEYIRKTVEIMEKQGSIAEDVDRKSVTMLLVLFAGTFIARYRFVKREVIDRIHDRLPWKDELVPRLAEMYNEPIPSLMKEPIPDEGSEGNMGWTVSW